SAAGKDSLTGLIDALEARDRMQQEVERAIDRAVVLLQLESNVAAAEEQFAELSQSAGAQSVTSAGQRQLIDVDTSLRGEAEKIDTLVLRLRNGTLALELLLERLRSESMRWQARLAQTPSQEPPDELQRRIKLVEVELSEQIQRLQPQRDQLLGLLDR